MSDEGERMDREEMIRVLRHNLGFPVTERWIEYGLRHGFRSVDATPVPNCPDCGHPSGAFVGQYVYYSTLLKLKECRKCGLIWTDARINSATIARHFQTAYKDEAYFQGGRRLIFGQLARIVTSRAPQSGSVLDIGGALGHLMHEVALARPDLHVVVNDVSEDALDHASTVFGLDTIHGPAREIVRYAGRYDVVVLSDVLYYEPDLPAVFASLAGLVRPGGTLVIRLPNKLALIRLSAWAARVFSFLDPGRPRDSIAFFNPEHLYVLSRRYVESRLACRGFTDICVLPSPTLESRHASVRSGAALMWQLARFGSWISRGRLVLTPAMVVLARLDPAISDQRI